MYKNALLVLIALAILWFPAQDFLPSAQSNTLAFLSSIIPTPTFTPSPSRAPIYFESKDIDEDVLWNLVNKHRSLLGLEAFTKDEHLCEIARERAPEIKLEYDSPHKGFLERYNGLPFVLAENGTGGDNPEDALNRWINSPSHRAALNGSWTYSCIACAGHDCVQIFTSYDTLDHNSPVDLPRPKCLPKYTCGDMVNCSDAVYYYKNCGRYNLDGDGDGIPCEDLCS